MAALFLLGNSCRFSPTVSFMSIVVYVAAIKPVEEFTESLAALVIVQIMNESGIFPFIMSGM